jgi:hypothetical protein
MAKPILALGRLSFDEDDGRVICQYGDGDIDRRRQHRYPVWGRCQVGSLA